LKGKGNTVSWYLKQVVPTPKEKSVAGEKSKKSQGRPASPDILRAGPGSRPLWRDQKKGGGGRTPLEKGDISQHPRSGASIFGEGEGE